MKLSRTREIGPFGIQNACISYDPDDELDCKLAIRVACVVCSEFNIYLSENIPDWNYGDYRPLGRYYACFEVSVHDDVEYSHFVRIYRNVKRREAAKMKRGE